MADAPDPRAFELDELLIRPGTYFNPKTEVLVVVDDSQHLDAEIFEGDEFDGAEWVLVSDETPIDEHERDELIERFGVRYHPESATSDGDDEPDDPGADEPEPDPED